MISRLNVSNDSPITIDVIIEGQLLVLQDVPFSKDTHSNFASDLPFRHIAVGITAVISETTNITFLCRVDVLVKNDKSENQKIMR